MQTQPNPYQPPGAGFPAPEGGYAHGAHPYEVQKLQGNLRILGGVQMAFGAIGSLGVLASKALLGSMSRSGVQREMNQIFEQGVVGTWMEVSRWVGLVAGVALFSAGISLFRFRPIGRSLTLLHASLAIVLVFVGLYMNLAYVFPALEDFARQGGPIAQAGARGGVIGGLFGSVLGLILPGFELYYMTRPGIRQALGMDPPG